MTIVTVTIKKQRSQPLSFSWAAAHAFSLKADTLNDFGFVFLLAKRNTNAEKTNKCFFCNLPRVRNLRNGS